MLATPEVKPGLGGGRDQGRGGGALHGARPGIGPVAASPRPKHALLHTTVRAKRDAEMSVPDRVEAVGPNQVPVVVDGPRLGRSHYCFNPNRLHSYGDASCLEFSLTGIPGITGQ